MKTSVRLVSLCTQGMVESMSVELMVALANTIIRNYDINERTGFPFSIQVPKKDAAHQILLDVKNMDLMVDFVNALVKTHIEGHMGREYPISNIRQIMREMVELGYLYDTEYKMFIENSAVQRTCNWGVLREKVEYHITFLRLDIAGNSVIVRENDASVVEWAYNDLRAIIEHAVHKRNGRIWSWEGDGVLAAFYFSRKSENAALAGMEIINELFIYNTIKCALNKPINVRVSVHGGPCTYTQNMEQIKKSDTIKKVIEIESKMTKLNSLTVSGIAGQHYNDILLSQLTTMDKGGSFKFLSYNLNWGN